MDRFDKAWLLVNSASGSNTPAALDSLRDCLCDNHVEVARTIRFPDDDLPSATELTDAGMDLLIVYTGDGTLNAAINQLRGWEGAILVLPGGTMNLLSKRLHGDRENTDILATVGRGGAWRTRPSVVSCAAGTALAGLLVGPGTRWGSVREAMRDFDLVAMASGAADAMREMTGDSMVRTRAPALGDPHGYPLIELTPGEHGIQLDAYHAESAGEFAAQGWAILRRNFREGPHDRLGVTDRIEIGSVDGSPLEVLIDGEAARLGAGAEFTMAACEVDLLATGNAD